jgi:shikimate kinase
MSLDFVDTDLLIQSRRGRRLQDILDGDGVAAFRRIEEEVVRSLEPARTVVATGGSVVYSVAAMEHLRGLGRVVYLHLPFAVWHERLRDFGSRGVVRAPGQSFESLYAEREPLYRRWAEVTVDTAGLSHEIAVERVVDALA